MEQIDLENLVNKGLEELQLDDSFLVEIRQNNNKIEVFLDSDTGIDFLKCQKVSRWLEAIFDESGTFGDDYVLEVSSPGVGSPLKMTRQYLKNIGRTIEVKTKDGSRIKGKLISASEDKIEVGFDTKVKEGKKNVTKSAIESIEYDNIIESKIKISFN